MRSLLLSAFICAAMVGISASALAGVITLQKHALIDHEAIYLSDVFQGLTAEQDKEIAVAPQPGQKVRYDYTILSRLAKMHDVEWQAHGYTDAVTIERDAAHITTDQIIARVNRLLKEQGVEGELAIHLDNKNLALHLPKNVEADFEVYDLKYDAVSHRFSGSLQAAQDTPAFVQANLTGRAISSVKVPVLSQSVQAGTIISASDIEWQEMPFDRAANYLRTADMVVGMEAKRNITAQMPMRTQDIIPPRIVERGSIVTLKIETPMMQITAQGRALQDGATGDVIRVVNTQSKRTIQGRVLGNGSVLVDVPQLLAQANQ